MRRAALLIALALLPGCRSLSATDLQLLRKASAVNLGHAQDAELPAEARLIGLDNYYVAEALLYSARGEPLPERVREGLKRTTREDEQ